jgi:hypothetical protein
MGGKAERDAKVAFRERGKEKTADCADDRGFFDANALPTLEMEGPRITRIARIRQTSALSFFNRRLVCSGKKTRVPIGLKS